MFRQLRQNFSVQFYIRLLERRNKSSVSHAVQAGSRADFNVPQSAHLALLFLAPLGHAGERMEQGLFGRSFFVRAVPLKALGQL